MEPPDARERLSLPARDSFDGGGSGTASAGSGGTGSGGTGSSGVGSAASVAVRLEDHGASPGSVSVLSAMASKCERLHLDHASSASHYNRVHGFLQLPGALLSASSSLIAFGSTPTGVRYKDQLTLLVGILTFVAAAMHTLVASCAFHRRAERHLAVARDCYALLHRIKAELSLEMRRDGRDVHDAVHGAFGTPDQRLHDLAHKLSRLASVPRRAAPAKDSPPEP